MKPLAPTGFSLTELIGHGGFTDVWKATHIDSGETVAIKVTKKSDLISEESYKRYNNELQIHKSLHHPFICPVFAERQNLTSTFLIIEYVPGGSLSQKLMSVLGISEINAKHYFAQIVEAVKYLHSLHICHHDLKLQNILVDFDNNIRIIDFGLSMYVEEKGTIVGTCGSPRYAAPELFEGIPHNEKVDIWSMGVILYRMLFGAFPFDDKVTQTMINKILNDEVNIPQDADKNLQALLRGMLEKNPEKRFSIEEIEQNPWFISCTKGDETLNCSQDFAGTSQKNKDLKTLINTQKISGGSHGLPRMSLERTSTLNKLIASGEFRQIPKKRAHRLSTPTSLPIPMLPK